MKNNKINKESNSKRNLSIFLVIIVGPIIFFLLFKNMQNEMDETVKEFPIVQTSDNLSGLIKEIEKIRRGDAIKIILNNNVQRILLHSTNDKYLPNNHLSHFLEKGDSIFKPRNSDSLFIYRNDKRYYFVNITE